MAPLTVGDVDANHVLRLRPGIRLDEDDRLISQADCRGCGYNLRGVAVRSTCPECGHVVADSLRTDLLEDSDPRWLGRVAIGCLLLA